MDKPRGVGVLTCGCEKKRQFETLKAAKKEAKRAKQWYKKPLKPYHCVGCGKYHLTSHVDMESRVFYRKAGREL
jgi:ferredoxin